MPLVEYLQFHVELIIIPRMSRDFCDRDFFERASYTAAPPRQAADGTRLAVIRVEAKVSFRPSAIARHSPQRSTITIDGIVS
jgi:hypothetical protein